MIRIAIIVGSTRPGRKAEDVAKWVYDTPQHTKDWSAKIASFDAYVFVTPEYYRSYWKCIPGNWRRVCLAATDR